MWISEVLSAVMPLKPCMSLVIVRPLIHLFVTCRVMVFLIHNTDSCPVHGNFDLSSASHQPFHFFGYVYALVPMLDLPYCEFPDR